MKLLFYFFLLLLLSFTAQTQVTKTANAILNGNAIQLDATLKLDITRVNSSEKDKYFVKDDGNNDPVTKPVVNYKAANKTLSFDFTQMYATVPAGTAFTLTLPGGSKKDIKQPGSTTTVPPGPNPVSAASPIKGYTGIAFWDAKAIKNLYDDKKDAAKQTILKYIRNYDSTVTWANINDNVFFKKVSIFQDIINSLSATPQSSAPSSPNILGSLGGLDVTKYVQAFADFLRDRIKEELTVAYLEKLKAMIEASEELKLMLPKTRTVFLTNDAFNIPNMGATYKSAFAEDLEKLLPNFEKMVYSLDKFKDLRTNDGFIGFMAAYHFVDMTAKDYHPADILRTLSQDFKFTNAGSPKTTYAIAIVNMFSQHLFDTSGKAWIGKNLLRNISKDEIYIFLGLLYEKYPVIFNTKVGKSSLVDILKDISEPVDKVYDLLAIINTVDERIKAFKQSADKKETVLTYFINNSDALLELINYSIDLVGGIDSLRTQDYYKWRSVVEHALAGAKAIRENDMGKLGVNVISVINELVPADEKWKRDLTEFIKILTDVVNAKTSRDIKALLEHYAAPAHSYRVARTYKTSVAFAAYPGLYGGAEYNGKSKSFAGTFGVTAPLGFSFSKRLKDSSSASLFISIFDIGAALTYRFNNDTADLPQNIYLGQIFSPGIFGIYGFRKSPLAIKYGVQYAPLLRTIKDGNNVYTDAGVWRASIALTVDIPVFIISRRK